MKMKTAIVRVLSKKRAMTNKSVLPRSANATNHFRTQSLRGRFK